MAKCGQYTPLKNHMKEMSCVRQEIGHVEFDARITFVEREDADQG